MPSQKNFKMVRLLAAVLLCALASFAPRAIRPQQQPAPVPGQISGHVYRSDTGEPLSKAVISLPPRFAASEAGRGARRGATDPSGQPDARSVLTAGDGSFTI